MVDLRKKPDDDNSVKPTYSSRDHSRLKEVVSPDINYRRMGNGEGMTGNRGDEGVSNSRNNSGFRPL